MKKYTVSKWVATVGIIETGLKKLGDVAKKRNKERMEGVLANKITDEVVTDFISGLGSVVEDLNAMVLNNVDRSLDSINLEYEATRTNNNNTSS